MQRGDFVTVVIPGSYGKPRPALILQTNAFADLHSVVVVPTTTDLVGATLLRIGVAPNAENGLERPSQLMVDKLSAVPRDRVGSVIGRASENLLSRVSAATAELLGLV